MNRDTARLVIRAHMHGLEGRPPALTHTQRDIVRECMASKRAAILGARQVVRKTTAVAYVAACWALGFDPETGGDIEPDTVQIVSKTEKHAQEFVRRATLILRKGFNVGVAKHKRDDSMLDERVGSLSRIRTALGTEIVAHAGNPNALQGFSGHVIVDEISANRNDPAEIYPNALAATFGREGRHFIMIGNASIVDDWWFNFWHGTRPADVARRNVFALTRHTVHSVYGDQLPQDLLDDCDAMGGQSSPDWRRWMLCEFVQGSTRALSDAEIESLHNARVTPDRRARVVVGFDPGGHPNPSGICVARVSANGIEVLHSEYWRGPRVAGDETKRAAWSATQVARVREAVRTYKAREIYVDHSSLAPDVGTALAEIFGDVCTLCRTTTDLRQARWGVLRQLIHDGVCHVPDTHTDLIEDLRALGIDSESRSALKRREGGVLVLPQIPDGGHILHCDVADALLLACESLIRPPA